MHRRWLIIVHLLHRHLVDTLTKDRWLFGRRVLHASTHWTGWHSCHRTLWLSVLVAWVVPSSVRSLEDWLLHRVVVLRIVLGILSLEIGMSWILLEVLLRLIVLLWGRWWRLELFRWWLVELLLRWRVVLRRLWLMHRLRWRHRRWHSSSSLVSFFQWNFLVV